MLYLGYTPGLFIVGLFAILILWMYANFWITGTLFIVGGMADFPLDFGLISVKQSNDFIYFSHCLYCYSAGKDGEDALPCTISWCIKHP